MGRDRGARWTQSPQFSGYGKSSIHGAGFYQGSREHDRLLSDLSRYEMRLVSDSFSTQRNPVKGEAERRALVASIYQAQTIQELRKRIAKLEKQIADSEERKSWKRGDTGVDEANGESPSRFKSPSVNASSNSASSRSSNLQSSFENSTVLRNGKVRGTQLHWTNEARRTIRVPGTTSTFFAQGHNAVGRNEALSRNNAVSRNRSGDGEVGSSSDASQPDESKGEQPQKDTHWYD